MTLPAYAWSIAVASAISAILGIAGCGGSTTCTATATCAGSDGAPGDAGLDGTPGDDAAHADATKTDACAPTEDCTNGVDDDCNGLIDCADPACTAGFTCVPEVPAGWTGPLAFVSRSGGPPAPSPPACPLGYPTDAIDGNAMPNAASASCSCACGPVAGAQCTDTTINYFTDQGCTFNCGSDGLFGGQCVASACSGANSASAEPDTPQGGSCTATPSQSIPPLGWEESMRACSAPSVGAGCSAGQVCAAKPPVPFDPAPCIAASGEKACPTGYSQTDTIYLGATDSRGCSECSCGPPAGVTCGGVTVTLYASTNCTGGAIGSMPNNYACAGALSSAAGSAVASIESVSGGSCSPAGGAPTGGVTPSMPTTVCCP